jgi:hypothetical protein
MPDRGQRAKTRVSYRDDSLLGSLPAQGIVVKVHTMRLWNAVGSRRPSKKKERAKPAQTADEPHHFLVGFVFLCAGSGEEDWNRFQLLEVLHRWR